MKDKDIIAELRDELETTKLTLKSMAQFADRKALTLKDSSEFHRTASPEGALKERILELEYKLKMFNNVLVSKKETIDSLKGTIEYVKSANYEDQITDLGIANDTLVDENKRILDENKRLRNKILENEKVLKDQKSRFESYIKSVTNDLSSEQKKTKKLTEEKQKILEKPDQTKVINEENISIISRQKEKIKVLEQTSGFLYDSGRDADKQLKAEIAAHQKTKEEFLQLKSTHTKPNIFIRLFRAIKRLFSRKHKADNIDTVVQKDLGPVDTESPALSNLPVNPPQEITLSNDELDQMIDDIDKPFDLSSVERNFIDAGKVVDCISTLGLFADNRPKHNVPDNEVEAQTAGSSQEDLIDVPAFK